MNGYHILGPTRRQNRLSWLAISVSAAIVGMLVSLIAPSGALPFAILLLMLWFGGGLSILKMITVDQTITVSQMWRLQQKGWNGDPATISTTWRESCLLGPTYWVKLAFETDTETRYENVPLSSGEFDALCAEGTRTVPPNRPVRAFCYRTFAGEERRVWRVDPA